MGYRLSPEQLEAIRPYAQQLATQMSGEGSKSSDSAITMEKGMELFPGASVVHVWQLTNFFARRIVVDVVGPNGKVDSVRLKPQTVLAK